MGVRDENSLRSAPKKPSRSAAFVRRLKPAERSPFEFASKGAARTSNRSQVRRASLAWLRNYDAGIAIAVGRRGGESSLRVNSLYFEFSIADYYRAFW
jgi:hypothetical protein